jgi:hypothetical protein
VLNQACSIMKKTPHRLPRQRAESRRIGGMAVPNNLGEGIFAPHTSGSSFLGGHLGLAKLLLTTKWKTRSAFEKPIPSGGTPNEKSIYFVYDNRSIVLILSFGTNRQYI